MLGNLIPQPFYPNRAMIDGIVESARFIKKRIHLLHISQSSDIQIAEEFYRIFFQITEHMWVSEIC